MAFRRVGSKYVTVGSVEYVGAMHELSARTGRSRGLGDGTASQTSRGAYTGAGGTPVHKQNLAECIGMRARSRLFEMCRVIWMPAVQDYRVQHGKVVKL